MLIMKNKHSFYNALFHLFEKGFFICDISIKSPYHMKADINKVSVEAKKDILELEQKINDFKDGKIIEDKFKHFRLTRGVYGQRQTGVQMFRIKVPFGKLTSEQLVRMADISERFTNGNLHLTTRQNIQMHHVKLEDSPEIWTLLEEKNITAREACGNTVRNLTGSANAGIDPDEPFDISPYVYASFQYFLRNPICQDMGRKIKPAFSSSDKDSAFTYFHDFGFIPKIKQVDGKEVRGFKVVVGGGLGAQAIVAQTAYEFLEENKIIPFMEACLRVFDRYGERVKRQKARMKFLVKKLGLDGFMELVEAERKALKNHTVEIDTSLVPESVPAPEKEVPSVEISDQEKYDKWLKTNIFEQKQKGFYALQIKVLLGDIHAEKARKLAALVKEWAADDIRITINQGFLLKFIRKEALPYLFVKLDELGLAEPGFGSTADITACPGTDTCNLAVTNSTGLTEVLEQVIKDEYPDLIEERNIQIKISGCMNACGQHMAANIGFHGSSIRHDGLVAPAMQVVLGGGVDPNGQGFIAEKVIKVPTKRTPDVIRTVLEDYYAKSTEGEYFNDYYYRQGKRYFYDILKPLGDKKNLVENDYQDWGQEETYKQEIGVGECAGVSYDVVAAIIDEANEKLSLSEEAFSLNSFADSIYHTYSSLVIGAKALLLSKDVLCNTQKGIIEDFDTHYVTTNEIKLDSSFADLTLQIKKNEPSEDFAKQYLAQANAFMDKVLAIRAMQLIQNGKDKTVIGNHYKA